MKKSSLKFPDLNGNKEVNKDVSNKNLDKKNVITFPVTNENKLSQKTTVPAKSTSPPIKVIFCLPGRSYSKEFLVCWSNLLFECVQKNVIPLLSQQYSSVVHFARAKCLGADVLRGTNQKPFNGIVEYDYICWIDSDIVFNTADFFKLLDNPYEINSGMYMTEDIKHYPMVQKWDTDFYQKHGSFQFLTPDDIEKIPKENDKYIPLEYNGMGFMLIKKGVFENISYPWFASDLQRIGELLDLSSEDVSFCRKATEAGYKIMCDTTIRVGHQKLYVI